MPAGNCSVCGQSGQVKRGMCEMHYRRFMKHGDPLVTKKAANGAGYLQVGYRGSQVAGVRKFDHAAIAESVLGRPLPPGAVVHHMDGDKLNNAKSNLAILPSRAYHSLIHQRLRAFIATGDPNMRRCSICKQYDNPQSIGETKQKNVHRLCANAAQLARYYKKKELSI